MTDQIEAYEANWPDFRFWAVDTPGLADTKLRTLEFIDTYLEAITHFRPKAIVYVCVGQKRRANDLKWGIEAFRLLPFTVPSAQVVPLVLY